MSAGATVFARRADPCGVAPTGEGRGHEEGRHDSQAKQFQRGHWSRLGIKTSFCNLFRPLWVINPIAR